MAGSEPHELLTEVTVRLMIERGVLFATVKMVRPAIWPKAIEYKGRIFAWTTGDEYQLVTPYKIS